MSSKNVNTGSFVNKKPQNSGTTPLFADLKTPNKIL